MPAGRACGRDPIQCTHLHFIAAPAAALRESFARRSCVAIPGIALHRGINPVPTDFNLSKILEDTTHSTSMAAMNPVGAGRQCDCMDGRVVSLGWVQAAAAAWHGGRLRRLLDNRQARWRCLEIEQGNPSIWITAIPVCPPPLQRWLAPEVMRGGRATKASGEAAERCSAAAAVNVLPCAWLALAGRLRFFRPLGNTPQLPSAPPASRLAASSPTSHLVTHSTSPRPLTRRLLVWHRAVGAADLAAALWPRQPLAPGSPCAGRRPPGRASNRCPAGAGHRGVWWRWAGGIPCADAALLGAGV